MPTELPNKTGPKKTISLTKEKFHKAIHSNIGTPNKKYIKIGHGKSSRRRAVSKEHFCQWADSAVDLKKKNITITVYIDFQKNNLETKEYLRLKKLACMGISEFWSRKITISGQIFTVFLYVTHRETNSIDVDIEINKSTTFARSHNSGFIDASFIYNQGIFPSNPSLADNYFKLTSAHEFGHSVLLYFGGIGLSWGHKGSTNVLLQSTKDSAPKYPIKEEIDLMMYYNKLNKSTKVTNIYQRTIAKEQDVKRIIWMSNCTIKE